MTDTSRVGRLADQWATPALPSAPPGPDAAPDTVRQRSVWLIPVAAAALAAEAERSGLSNGKIIAAAHATHRHVAVAAAAAPLHQRTFFLPDRQIEEIDAAAAQAGCTRGEYLCVLLVAALPAARQLLPPPPPRR